MARIGQLTTYPVKGCAGVSLTAVQLTPAGLQHDRSFLVVDPDGRFRSQRRSPRLATVQPEVSADGVRLSLYAPGVEPVRVAVTVDAPRCDVELFGQPFQGVDQGAEAAEWLTTVLGERSRLVRVPPDHHRVTGGQVPGTAAYADGAAVHLLSVGSLTGLNDRILAAGGSPVPRDRFRPNIVLEESVDGRLPREAHWEDLIRRVRFGETELAYTKLAARCAVTLVDQATGGKAGPEPLRTLARYRRDAGGSVAFGLKLAVVHPGLLMVGQEAVVTAWGPSELEDPRPAKSTENTESTDQPVR